MEARSRKLVPSGIEPVDKLVGGLDGGQLYLVHGEASGKSLFGIRFLIEGLKRGERGALVSRYPLEDAVRKFGRLGYDCVDDISSGRLVILQYSSDIVQQIDRLDAMAAALRQLEWLLGTTRPDRLMFDPVTELIAGTEGDLHSRVRVFADWARSFGATVVLIANGNGDDVVVDLKALVRESFRFELKEADDRAVRYLVFEKSPAIADQAIEVDPSRGVFLAARTQADSSARTGSSSIGRAEEDEPLINLWPLEESPQEEARSRGTADLGSPPKSLTVPPEQRGSQAAMAAPPGGLQPPDDQSDILSELLDEIVETSWPLEGSRAARPQAAVRPESVPEVPPVEQAAARPGRGGPTQELDVDSALASHAAEMLLRPPAEAEARVSPFAPPQPETPSARPSESYVPVARINPKEFNVLVIDDDPSYCEAIAQALGEYTVATVNDGVAGLAKLISFKPDLLVLDVDLPVIDGFKILGHIRSSLNMPIIVVSGSHMRASDRVLSAELGADYYLTKPFSVKELRQKAKQLIARYRGIASWIVTGPGVPESSAEPPSGLAQDRRGASAARPQAAARASSADYFTSYQEFVERVEKNVRASVDTGASFSIVGCRVPQMTGGGGRAALRLLELTRLLVRDSDLISTNPRNDIVILLGDADLMGARAFISRLRERVRQEWGQEPEVWTRSFPDLESAPDSQQPASSFGRRSTDKPTRDAETPRGVGLPRTAAIRTSTSERPDPRVSYIDLLEKR